MALGALPIGRDTHEVEVSCVSGIVVMPVSGLRRPSRKNPFRIRWSWPSRGVGFLSPPSSQKNCAALGMWWLTDEEVLRTVKAGQARTLHARQ